MIKTDKLIREGQPIKFTPAKRKGVIELIREGKNYSVAGRAYGISDSNIYRWREKGKKETEGKYYEFYKALIQAEEEGAINKKKREEIEVIRKAEGAEKRIGRPIEFTEEKRAKVIALVKAGNYKKVAAAACGIHYDTLMYWQTRGKREEKGMYREFYEALEQAEGEGEARLVVKIVEDGSWQALMTILERKYPERWGRLSRVELTGKEGGAIEIDQTTAITRILDAMSPEGRTELMRVMNKLMIEKEVKQIENRYEE